MKVYDHVENAHGTREGGSLAATPAHIRLLSRQSWSDSDVIAAVIRACIEFRIRELILIAVFCGARELVAPLRQEVRENHLER